MDPENTSADVLVIGVGAAGIRAALAASGEGVDVILASKTGLGRSGSTFSHISRGWGIQGLVGEERTNKNLEAFCDDIVRVGLGQCNLKLVRILVEESGERIKDLMSWGIRFKKDPHGRFIREKGCFSKCKRAFVTEDFDNLIKSCQSILQRSSVKSIACYATGLVMADANCWGALALFGTGKILQIRARATILATGGGAGIFQDHLVTNGQVGDGYALAKRAGAKLINMEFIQFMLGLKTGDSRRFLPLSYLRTPGILLDQNNHDILKTHIPDQALRTRSVMERQEHFPFSCRDSSRLVDIAVVRSKKEGGKVYWRQNGFEENMAQVAHFSHAFNGGVEINEWAESTVPGLYAAGEAAAGPHGADRIGGCMMTATQVFGYRAGVAAAGYAKKRRFQHYPEIKQPGWVGHFKKKAKGRDDGHEIGQAVKDAMTRDVLVLRDETGLKRSRERLNECEERLWKRLGDGCLSVERFCELRNMISTGKLVSVSALARKESKGGHFLTQIGNAD